MKPYFVILFYILYLSNTIVQSYDANHQEVIELMEANYEWQTRLKEFLEVYYDMYIFMKMKIKEYDDEQTFLETDKDKYLSHPLNVFMLNKRIGLDFMAVTRSINDMSKDYLTRMDKTLMKGLPETAIKKAYRSYLKMRKFEHSNIKELANGMIGKEKFRSNMTAMDCYFIGHVEHLVENYEDSNTWLQLCHDRFDEREGKRYNLKKSELFEKMGKNKMMLSQQVAQQRIFETTDRVDKEMAESQRKVDEVRKILDGLADDAYHKFDKHKFLDHEEL